MALNELSEQENRIAHLVSNGYIVKEIADQLCISTHTAATHLRNIRQKTGAKNIADITRKYILSLAKPTDVFRVVVLMALQYVLVFGGSDDLYRRGRRSQRNRVRIVRLK